MTQMQSTSGSIVSVNTLVSLGDVGLPTSSFRFGQLTMDSEKYVTVKDGSEVAIVDLSAGNSVMRRPMKAEGALTHPERLILALKGAVDGTPGQYVQVYDLNSKTKLFNHQFSQGVVYWKWVSSEVLALVTDSAVFHWNMATSTSPEAPPSHIFDRSGPLAGSACQIIGYSSDHKLNWCLLSGISSNDGGRTVDGHLQLYSNERKQGRTMDGHAGCFADLFVSDEVQTRVTTFTWVDKATLNVMDLTKSTSFRVQTSLDFSDSLGGASGGDFAVFVAVNERQGLGYLVTKAGLAVVFDPATGLTLARVRISQDPVFLGTSAAPSAVASVPAVLVVNRRGQVLGISANEASLISFVNTQLQRPDVGMTLCRRYPVYAGSEELVLATFNQYMSQADFKRAAELVARSASSSPLRSGEILNRFRSAVVLPGQPSAMSVYFSTLLDSSSAKLNAVESLELVRPVAAQGRRELIEKWLREERLTYSDELAEVVRQCDPKLAVVLFAKAGRHDRVLAVLAETGNVDQVLAYVERVRASGAAGAAAAVGDLSSVLRVLVVTQPEGSVRLAKELLSKHLVSVESVFETYTSLNRVPELTAVMVDHLRGNRPEEGKFQTRLLELNISKYPQAAEALFQVGAFSQFDKLTVAKACEKAHLYMRACELYGDFGNIRRCLLAGVNNTAGAAGVGGAVSGLSPEWVVKFVSALAPAEAAVEVVGDLLRYNKENNMSTAVQIAVKLVGTGSGETGGVVEKLVQQFEQLDKSRVGLYHFLGGALGQLHAKAALQGAAGPSATGASSGFGVAQLTEKYVEVAVSLGEWSEVERQVLVGRYDGHRMRDILKAQATTAEGARSYQVLCEKQGFVEELVQYQLKRGDSAGVKELVKRLVANGNSVGVGNLLGVLLDQGADEHLLAEVLGCVSGSSGAAVIEAFTSRNRLRSLRHWLEKQATGGSREASTALAKIYIDLNIEPSKYLAENSLYDTLAVGQYAAMKDPYLAVQAYKKGNHSGEVVDVCERNQLHKVLAEYLVEQQDQTLWSQVLGGVARRGLVDAVIHAGILGKSAEAISATVKAFMAADMSAELLELLERIVLPAASAPGGAPAGDFGKNRSLQNLLLLTAIRAAPAKVKEYITRLDNYDGAEIAKVAIGEPHRLYEEALEVYVKFGLLNEAMDVLLYNLEDLPRAVAFAESHAPAGSQAPAGSPAQSLWSRVARAQLDNGLVKEAIASYIRADEAKEYVAVIEAAHREEEYGALIEYLSEARKKVRDSTIDTELLYALCRESATGVQEFLDSGNSANVNLVADRLMEEKLLKQARLLYAHTNNFAKLTVCLLGLGELAGAVEAAKKANSPKIWWEVLHAATKTSSTASAGSAGGSGASGTVQVAGLHLIAYPDELEAVVSLFDSLRMQGELVSLLETAVSLDKATHIGVYTELGVLYAKREPAKLGEFVKTHGKKVNVVKVVRICESLSLWREASLLLSVAGDYEGSLNLILSHPSAGYSGHEEFLQLCKKVTNSELIYRAVEMYIATFPPSQLLSLLGSVGGRVDQTRLVGILRKTASVSSVVEYLKQVQQNSGNIQAVNEALNDFYLEQGDFENLQISVSNFAHFDKASLAGKLEKCENVEARRIAALLYAKNKNHKQAVELLKQQGLFLDAINTVKDAHDAEAAKALVKYFVEHGKKEEFAEALKACRLILKPDFVLELAWKAEWTDLAMPFMIVTLRDMHEKIDKLEADRLARERPSAAPTPSHHPLALTAPGISSFSQSSERAQPGTNSGSAPNHFPF